MGNVLLKYDTDLPLGAFCPDEEAKNFIRRELFESAEWIEADRGNITDGEMLAAAKERVPKEYHDALENVSAAGRSFWTGLTARLSSAAR